MNKERAEAIKKAISKFAGRLGNFFTLPLKVAYILELLISLGGEFRSL